MDAMTYDVKWVDGRWCAVWADGTILPMVRGGSDPSNTDDGDGDDDADDDDDDEDGDDEDSKPPKDEDDPVKRANDEAKRRRLEAKQLKKELNELKRQNQERENSGKDEAERFKGENEQLKEAVNVLTEKLTEQTIRNAIIEEMPAVGFKDSKRKSVLRAIDRELIEVDDDDWSVTGVREALDALAKEEPEWLASNSNNNNNGDNKDDLPSTGAAHNNKKRKPQGTSQSELAKKYPALRR